jgi:hypothetical protein
VRETKNIGIRREKDIQIKETGTEREPDTRWKRDRERQKR